MIFVFLWITSLSSTFGFSHSLSPSDPADTLGSTLHWSFPHNLDIFLMKLMGLKFCCFRVLLKKGSKCEFMTMIMSVNGFYFTLIPASIPDKVICISRISRSVFQGTLVPRGFLWNKKKKKSVGGRSCGHQLWATLSWKFTRIRQPIKGFEKTCRKENVYDFCLLQHFLNL